MTAEYVLDLEWQIQISKFNIVANIKSALVAGADLL